MLSQENIFTKRFYPMFIPCVTSQCGMFLFLEQKCTRNKHIKGNQQHKKMLNSDMLLYKKDIDHFQQCLIKLN